MVQFFKKKKTIQLNFEAFHSNRSPPTSITSFRFIFSQEQFVLHAAAANLLEVLKGRAEEAVNKKWSPNDDVAIARRK